MCRTARYVPRPLLAETYLARTPGTRGFLEAIAEEPWNDGLRLILADYLEEERGDEARARFIRLQVRRQSFPEGTAPWSAWTHEEKALVEDHRAAWLDGLPAEPCLNLYQAFAGGLVEMLPTVSVDLGEVLTQAGKRIDVRRVWWFPTEREALVLGLASARLSHLRVHEPGDSQAAQLADTPHLRHLAELNLCCGRMGLPGAQAVAASPHLGQLSRLLFHSLSLGPGVAAAVAGSDTLTGLTLLSLDGNQIGDEGAAALAGAAHLRGLTHLFLGDNEIGPVGMDLLTGSPWLIRVSHLNLSSNRLDAAGVAALVTWPQADRLSYLDLSGNPIGDDGAALLAEADGLDNLTLLGVADCQLSDEGQDRLRERYGNRVWLDKAGPAA